MKCRKCGLVFSNPMPIPKNIQEHYGITPEKYWQQHHFKNDNTYFQREINVLGRLFEIKNGMSALDIGAGTGRAMHALKKAGFDAYGIEPSESFYKRAIETYGFSNDMLKLGMIENTEYHENTFDFITFRAVLEHLYNPSESIKKAMRWLKPGGIIHIEVPCSDWLINKLANFYYRLIGTNYVANISPMHEPYHLYEFGPKSFSGHAIKNNYKIIHTEYFIGDTYLPKIISFFLKLYMKWTRSGMIICVWLKKNN